MENQNQNPITKLAEAIQQLYGKNIETFVVSKVGKDHNPTIEVKILLPNENEYFAEGGNQRIAKRLAAEKALEAEDLI